MGWGRSKILFHACIGRGFDRGFPRLNLVWGRSEHPLPTYEGSLNNMVNNENTNGNNNTIMVIIMIKISMIIIQ